MIAENDKSVCPFAETTQLENVTKDEELEIVNPSFENEEKKERNVPINSPQKAKIKDYAFLEVHQMLEAVKTATVLDRLPILFECIGLFCLDGQSNYVDYRDGGSMTFSDQAGAWGPASTTYKVIELNVGGDPAKSRLRKDLKWKRSLKQFVNTKTKEVENGDFIAMKSLTMANISNPNYKKRVTTFQAAPEKLYFICYRDGHK